MAAGWIDYLRMALGWFGGTDEEPGITRYALTGTDNARLSLNGANNAHLDLAGTDPTRLELESD